MANEQQTQEIYIVNDELMHYGTPRHSGRYPWGSGENPYQHSGDFLARVHSLEKEGKTEKEIADILNLTTTKLRAYKSLALEERKSDLYNSAKSMRSDGYTYAEIADKLGLKGESTVRYLLNASTDTKIKLAEKTANNLKNIVDEKGMIDVGAETERVLGISKEKLNQSLEILKAQGYEVYGGRVPQATNKGQQTTIKVLCVPGTPFKDIFVYDKVNSLSDYTSRDDGNTLEPGFLYPSSLDSKRLDIVYGDQGGTEKDGLIELRKGVKDISLGESMYSQVRILVDGTHYIKGMAVYADDLPEGIDVRFNTNKPSTKSKLEVLKPIKDDPDNPFGSFIKENGGQSFYDDPNGKYVDPVTGHKQSLSVINKRADEGDWESWSKSLPSQFLSKQRYDLINKQLNLSISDKQDEYSDILALTNPTIKRNLLESFAEDCDSAAVQLKAAALPGQRYQVILPMTSLKDNECYAPNYKDGSQLALVRYPHGGTFEIPIVTVNNRNKEGKSMLGNNPTDAIGINSNVAGRLSGADFDGDTVMVIPLNNKVNILSTPKLFDNFDPKLEYGTIEKDGKYYRNGNEVKIMTDTQKQMGMISNLITDMTLKGATNEEKARAVKHSMVVIDAEKHKLDYKASEKDNNIAELKKLYQSKVDEEGKVKTGGASTLISLASSPIRDIPERKDGAFFAKDTGKELKVVDEKKNIYIDTNTGETYNRSQVNKVYVDPKTGKKLYHDTNRTYFTYDKNNNLVEKPALSTSTKMAETEDARTLSSGTWQEEAYAKYANTLKRLANDARKTALTIKDIPYSPSARSTYIREVESLDNKLNEARLNAPKERRAQLIAASRKKAIFQDNPHLTNEEKDKISQQELTKARAKVGAKRNPIYITDKEWEAIQAGAISHTKLQQIINDTDKTRLKELSTPKNSKTVLSSSKINRIKNMSNSGYTTEEIADSLDISVSTVLKSLKGE